MDDSCNVSIPPTGVTAPTHSHHSFQLHPSSQDVDPAEEGWLLLAGIKTDFAALAFSSFKAYRRRCVRVITPALDGYGK